MAAQEISVKSLTTGKDLAVRTYSSCYEDLIDVTSTSENGQPSNVDMTTRQATSDIKAVTVESCTFEAEVSSFRQSATEDKEINVAPSASQDEVLGSETSNAKSNILESNVIVRPSTTEIESSISRLSISDPKSSVSESPSSEVETTPGPTSSERNPLSHKHSTENKEAPIEPATTNDEILFATSYAAESEDKSAEFPPGEGEVLIVAHCTFDGRVFFTKEFVPKSKTSGSGHSEVAVESSDSKGTGSVSEPTDSKAENKSAENPLLETKRENVESFPSQSEISNSVKSTSDCKSSCPEQYTSESEKVEKSEAIVSDSASQTSASKENLISATSVSEIKQVTVAPSTSAVDSGFSVSSGDDLAAAAATSTATDNCTCLSRIMGRGCSCEEDTVFSPKSESENTPSSQPEGDLPFGRTADSERSNSPAGSDDTKNDEKPIRSRKYQRLCLLEQTKNCSCRPSEEKDTACSKGESGTTPTSSSYNIEVASVESAGPGTIELPPGLLTTKIKSKTSKPIPSCYCLSRIVTGTCPCIPTDDGEMPSRSKTDSTLPSVFDSENSVHAAASAGEEKSVEIVASAIKKLSLETSEKNELPLQTEIVAVTLDEKDTKSTETVNINLGDTEKLVSKDEDTPTTTNESNTDTLPIEIDEQSSGVATEEKAVTLAKKDTTSSTQTETVCINLGDTETVVSKDEDTPTTTNESNTDTLTIETDEQASEVATEKKAVTLAEKDTTSSTQTVNINRGDTETVLSKEEETPTTTNESNTDTLPIETDEQSSGVATEEKAVTLAEKDTTSSTQTETVCINLGDTETVVSKDEDTPTTTNESNTDRTELVETDEQASGVAAEEKGYPISREPSFGESLVSLESNKSISPDVEAQGTDTSDSSDSTNVVYGNGIPSRTRHNFLSPEEILFIPVALNLNVPPVALPEQAEEQDHVVPLEQQEDNDTDDDAPDIENIEADAAIDANVEFEHDHVQNGV